MKKSELLMVVTGVVISLGLGVNTIFGSEDEMVREEITIGKGETLYQVVASRVNEKNNINDVVREALRANDIHDAGKIQPNQKIVITYKK